MVHGSMPTILTGARWTIVMFSLVSVNFETSIAIIKLSLVLVSGSNIGIQSREEGNVEGVPSRMNNDQNSKIPIDSGNS